MGIIVPPSSSPKAPTSTTTSAVPPKKSKVTAHVVTSATKAQKDDNAAGTEEKDIGKLKLKLKNSRSADDISEYSFAGAKRETRSGGMSCQLMALGFMCLLTHFLETPRGILKF